MPKRFTLGKSERLKSRKSLEELFAQGTRFSAGTLRVVYRRVPGTGELRLGVGVSSKSFRKAVDRNRVKRLLREAWRVQKNGLQEQIAKQNNDLLVFISYSGRELPGYKQVFSHTGDVTRKLIENTYTS